MATTATTEKYQANKIHDTTPYAIAISDAIGDRV